MIGHYLSSNNKMCCHTKTNIFSPNKHALTSQHAPIAPLESLYYISASRRMRLLASVKNGQTVGLASVLEGCSGRCDYYCSLASAWYQRSTPSIQWRAQGLKVVYSKIQKAKQNGYFIPIINIYTLSYTFRYYKLAKIFGIQ